MVTLSELISLNKSWDDYCFITVFDLANNATSRHLRLRFAMSLYGSRLVKRFNACSVWVE